MDPEIYKITSVDEMGMDVSAYASPAEFRLFSRMMRDQYGNVTIEGLQLRDLPEDVLRKLEKSPFTQ